MSENNMKKIAAAIATALLTGCGVPTETPAPSTSAPDAIDQMMVSFEGQPSRTDIKSLLDPAMQATNTPTTDDNYSRAGSTLVSLRQKNGTPEMRILKCMPSRKADPRITRRGYEVNFGTVAAVCSVDILQGRYLA